MINAMEATMATPLAMRAALDMFTTNLFIRAVNIKWNFTLKMEKVHCS